MKEDTSDNDNLNDNLYIDNVDTNAGIDKVLISTSSSLDDEEDLSAGPSGDTYAQNDDLMNILSKGKKEFKDTYEDPIRMYLKEIGDVKLLSRKDEEVLARTIDLKYKYKNMYDELNESSPDLINSIDLIKQIFESLVTLKPGISTFSGPNRSIVLMAGTTLNSGLYCLICFNLSQSKLLKIKSSIFNSPDFRYSEISEKV